MNDAMIKKIMKNHRADDFFIDFLKEIPSIEYKHIIDIMDKTEENGADWATRQFQSVARKYLSKDNEIIKMIDAEDEEMSK